MNKENNRICTQNISKKSWKICKSITEKQSKHSLEKGTYKSVEPGNATTIG